MHRHTVAAKTVEQAFNEPTIGCAQHWVIDGGGTEWAVISNDGVGQASNAAVGREPLCRQGVGHRLHRRAEGSWGVPRRHLRGEGATVLGSHLVGDLFGLDRVHYRQQPAQQGEEQVVTKRWYRSGGVAGAREVALGGTPDTGIAPVDVDVEIATGRKFVQVMARDVGVQGELIGHLRSGHPVALAGKQVDLSPRCVSEGGRDRGYCR